MQPLLQASKEGAKGAAALTRVLTRPELRADALQEVDHVLPLGVQRRGAERQVLHDVRDAALVLLLRDGADANRQPQLGALLRLAVLPDVPAQAVGQPPGAQLGRERQAGARGRRRVGHRLLRLLRRLALRGGLALRRGGHRVGRLRRS